MKQFVHKISELFPIASSALKPAPFTSESSKEEYSTDRTYLLYTQSVTALAAKIACVDDTPNKAEFDAFASLFAFKKMDPHLLKRVFIKHAQDQADGYEQHASNLARMMISATEREELLRRLTLLAACDGTPNPQEIECLKQVSDMLGLTEARWRSVLLPHLGLAQPRMNPYRVLGISKRASVQEIKNRYHELAFQVHPDQLAAASLSTATRDLLEEYFRMLMQAYEMLVKQRKL